MVTTNELTVAQLASLLRNIRLVVPDARFAPEESWIAGENAEGEAVEFEGRCVCGDYPYPAKLTLFISAPDLDSLPANVHASLVHAIRRWATANLVWEGCADCGHELDVDLRLFKTKPGRT